jgi:transcription elongation factor GreB
VSKAFTKEDDAGEQVVVDRLPPPREPAPVAAEVAASGVARAGAFVTLDDGSEYQLVEPAAADLKARRVSVESPLGRALLGKKAGERIVVERPRGTLRTRVASVRY